MTGLINEVGLMVEPVRWEAEGELDDKLVILKIDKEVSAFWWRALIVEENTVYSTSGVNGDFSAAIDKATAVIAEKLGFKESRRININVGEKGQN